jgi:hypothetical protein
MQIVIVLPLTFFVIFIFHRPLGVIPTVNASVPRDQNIYTVTGVTVIFNSIKSGHVVYFLNKIKQNEMAAISFLIHCYFRSLTQ